MKITEVKILPLKKKLSRSMRISRGGFTSRTHLLVQVCTDAGITGLGEAIGNAPLIEGILRADLAGRAVGFDPMDIEGLRKALMDNHVYFERKGSAICAFSAIETACWDIRGKALGVPVYQLLGGKGCDRLEAYASDIYWEEDVEEIARDAERLLEKGFRNLKAHIGCQPPEIDIQRVRRLREAVGRDVRLMIDLNCGYTPDEANRALELWGSYDLFWLEEPVAPESTDVLASLRRRSKAPIAFGENEFRVQGFRELFEKQAVDIAMPDIGRAGGIQETRNICTMAQRYGVPVSPHNFSSGVLMAATMHLMAATPGTMLLEFDASENPVMDELLVEPLRMKNGSVEVPQSPGLGVQLTESVLDKYFSKKGDL